MKLRNIFQKSSKPCRKKLNKIKTLSAIEQKKIQTKRNEERTKRQFKIVENKLNKLIWEPIRDPITGRITIGNKSYPLSGKLYESILLETYREYLTKYKNSELRSKIKPTDPRYKLYNFKLTRTDVEKIKLMLITKAQSHKK